MADVRRFDDAALEGALAALGREIAYPRGRDLWPDVRQEIHARELRRRSLRVRASLATAALVVLVAAALIISPDARALAREILRFGGIQIVPVPAPSVPPPSSAGLDIGRSATMAEAARGLGRPVLVPGALSDPDEVRIRTTT